MLTALRIHNFVIIDELSLEFKQGLCILTGETGAGKSILLDALGLVLGGKIDKKPVGPKADKAIITAEFDLHTTHPVHAILEAHDIPQSDTIILKRAITANGRSKASINDTPVSVQILKAIGEQLIEIHGQHESHHLLDPKTHLNLLDQYGDYGALMDDVKALSQTIKQLEREKAALIEKIQVSEKEASFIEFTLEEINALAYVEGEEKTLDEQCFKLKQAEKLKDSLRDVEKILNHPVSIGDQIFKAEKTLSNFADNIDATTVDQISQLFADANHAITEAESQLQMLQRQLMDAEDTSIEAVEERLLDLKDFAAKHRIPVHDILDYQAKLEAQLKDLDDSQQALDAVTDALNAEIQAYHIAAESLHAARTKTAAKLDQNIMKEFKPLKLEKVKFNTRIDKIVAPTPAPHGYDEIEFMIQTNPGSPEGSLTKIASGGEFSRIILAIKVILSQSSVTPVFIFDEVDTGIGGAVADAVGSRLERLAQKFQLFVITHSPQVAAKADHHYHVSKIQDATSTRTVVKNLSTAAVRLEEIARMLSGDQVSDQAREAANQLIGTKNKQPA